MQKISFGNKQYVKASEAAKKFRYTQDYVGQLCRAKKVDARLVGRTWYVELDSVTEYRKTKHKTQKKTKAAVTNKKPTRTIKRKKVAPVIRAKTIRATSPDRQKSDRGVHVSYGSDDQVSIPIVSKKTTPEKTVTVVESVAESSSVKKTVRLKQRPKKIKIARSRTKQTKFKSDKIPEISLSGKLKVSEISVEEDRPPAPDSELSEIEKAARIVPVHDMPMDDSEDNSDSDEVKPSTDQSESTNLPTKSAPQAEKRPKVTNFAPKQVQQAQKASRRPAKSPATKARKLPILPVVCLLLALVASAAILSAASVGNVASGESPSWSLFFDFAALKNLLF